MFSNKLYSRVFPTLLNLTLLILLIGSAAIPSPVHADSVITVATNADTIAPDGLCSLREAITNANADAQTYNDCVGGSGNDTIQFNDILGTATITLDSSLPDITDIDGLTINGGGDITVSGNNSYRITIVNSNVPLTLNGLTATNAKPVSTSGGAIHNSGTLTITNSTFSNNNTVQGGAIYNNSGTLLITNSIFSGNSSGYGGAIASSGITSIVNITNSVFSGNSSSSGSGGSGVYSEGTLTIRNSSFINNTHPGGRGVIYNSQGTASISNSTFSGNSSGSGSNNVGGIYNSNGPMTITNSTFSGNSTSGFGGSGDIYQLGSSSTLYLYNNILANSAGGGDCRVDNGTVAGNNNLIEDASTACGFTNNVNGNIIGSDPALGSLTGSPTYFPLLAGSPAIDTGNDAICTATPVSNTSQNGVTRPQGSHCDIGSYELNSPMYKLFLPLLLR